MRGFYDATTFILWSLLLLSMPQYAKSSLTVFVYADGDEFDIMQHNQLALMKPGSLNQEINLLTQIEHTEKEYVQRYISKGNVTIPVELEKKPQTFCSVENFLTFLRWGIAKFPSKYNVLIFSGHGRGFSQEPFVSIPGHRFISRRNILPALAATHNLMEEKKFDLIVYDSCLMGDLETALLMQPYAHYLVASEDCVTGEGLPYLYILQAFITDKPTNPLALAKHIIRSHGYHYSNSSSYNDMSVFDLSNIHLLKDNVEQVAQLFLDGLHDAPDLVRKTLLACQKQCHHLARIYVDIEEFYRVLLASLNDFVLTDDLTTQKFRHSLHLLISQGLSLMPSIAIARWLGKGRDFVHGLSLYFPEQKPEIIPQKYPSGAWYAVIAQLLELQPNNLVKS